MRLQALTENTPQTHATSGPRAWPDAVAYREAVQNPQTALADPLLRGAQVAGDRLGLPVAYSGRFAVVFRLHTTDGDWALRCFTQAGESALRKQRYQAVSDGLAGHQAFFVPFRYLEQGIKVGAHWFPAVAMRWAEGEPLGRWLDEHHDRPVALRRLCRALADLITTLERAGIAHGDWQHDNLLVSDDGRRVTLVDYDGVFVPALAGAPSPELGHPNYQHPARHPEQYAVGLDRFAHLVIQTALLALVRDPTLWRQFSDGECVLFKKADLQNPPRSAVFAAVGALGRDDATLAECASKLEAACASSTAAQALLDAGPVLPPAVLEAEKQSPDPERVRARDAAGVEDSKWWLVGGARAAPQSASTPALAAKLSPAANAPEFVTRLAHPETIAFEQTNLGTLRISLLARALIFGGLWAFTGHHGLVQFACLVSLLLVGVSFAAWPRKKIKTELRAAIAVLDERIDECRQRIADGHATLGLFSTTFSARNAAEFAAAELRHVPLAKAAPGQIGAPTLRRLQAAGVTTAADLIGRINALNLPPGEGAALTQWLDTHATQARHQYQQGVARRIVLEQNIADLEQAKERCRKERNNLEGEQQRYPDASFSLYLRKVLKVA